MRQGATDYVLKQRLERLVPAVQRALRESQERQERQNLAVALQQTDNLLRTIVDESPVSIITLSREQRVITWNASAEELYGWSADAVIDRPLPMIPDAERPTHDFYFNQALQATTVANHECQHHQKDGSLVDGLDQGTTFTIDLPQRMTTPSHHAAPIAQAAANISDLHLCRCVSGSDHHSTVGMEHLTGHVRGIF